MKREPELRRCPFFASIGVAVPGKVDKNMAGPGALDQLNGTRRSNAPSAERRMEGGQVEGEVAFWLVCTTSVLRHLWKNYL